MAYRRGDYLIDELMNGFITGVLEDNADCKYEYNDDERGDQGGERFLHSRRNAFRHFDDQLFAL